MALQSVRFAGVPELEACAVDHAAHLLHGHNGHHVALVQEALVDLGEDLGAGGADGVYGDDTSRAVTSYKTARGILNASGAIDAVVGKLTIAALDDEIAAHDATLPVHDGSTSPPVDGEVDLAGVPEPAVNALLGRVAAGTVVEVDAEGVTSTRLGTAADAGTTELLVGVARAVAGALGADPEPSRSALVGILPQVAGSGVAAFPDVVGTVLARLPLLAVMPVGASLLGDLLAQVSSPHVPARDLTKPQALAIAAAAHAAGVITMTPAPVLDAAGAVVSPVATEPVSIGSTIGPVTFRTVAFGDRSRPPGTPMGYDPVTTSLLALDVRHLVGLLRLADHLHRSGGVTEIHHVGISGARDPRGDCHRQGRAIDLVGLRGVAADTPYTLTILNDWGRRSVPNLAHPTRPRLPDWPPGSRTLEYRLTSLPDADGFARRVFAELYAFFTAEYQDRTAGPGQTEPASVIGTSSFVMHPDHPTSAPGTKHGREAHANHYHAQIGPTGKQAP
ncbi:peptidoglycan-binding domain-containing protein [Cellulomonas carbonis]|uniref:Peptidoglycan binding-like domain-containing protein n=1 Tax=Cellulomonas carbonis T26 TaxID=947969 RepID=A0A0A0BTW0_9CELL|nr:peptidoglycan-binding domain-containing protein [Cellulomonas carbonis]KGM11833.1 hypothetical protein N868_06115 [Cellulomonas carbonis T26]GGB92110.1 hypothetical protein GCM10010972_00970 [Cellulomonas carbonis]